MSAFDDLTVREAREFARIFVGGLADAHPWKVGEQYFIRTVTMHLIGRLVEVYPQELVLESTVWVADSGRFAEAMRTGKLEEVEPFPAGRVIVGRGGIIDAAIWSHALPTEVK